MTTAIADADPLFPGPPLGDREFRRFVTGLGIVYVVAILALFTKLLVFPASRAGPAPVIAGANQHCERRNRDPHRFFCCRRC